MELFTVGFLELFDIETPLSRVYKEIEKLTKELERVAKEARLIAAEYREKRDLIKFQREYKREDLNPAVEQLCKILHERRCNAIMEASAIMRTIATLSAGDLILDETTVGTPLTESQRRMISEVSGNCEWPF